MRLEQIILIKTHLENSNFKNKHLGNFIGFCESLLSKNIEYLSEEQEYKFAEYSLLLRKKKLVKSIKNIIFDSELLFSLCNILWKRKLLNQNYFSAISKLEVPQLEILNNFLSHKRILASINEPRVLDFIIVCSEKEYTNHSILDGVAILQHNRLLTADTLNILLNKAGNLSFLCNLIISMNTYKTLSADSLHIILKNENLEQVALFIPFFNQYNIICTNFLLNIICSTGMEPIILQEKIAQLIKLTSTEFFNFLIRSNLFSQNEPSFQEYLVLLLKKLSRLPELETKYSSTFDYGVITKAFEKIIMLLDLHLLLSHDYFHDFMELSPAYYPNFLNVLEQLQKHNHVNGNAVTTLLNHFNNKIQIPLQEYFRVEKTKTNEQHIIEFAQLDTGFTIVVERKKNEPKSKGARGDVFQAQSRHTTHSPYLLKKLRVQSTPSRRSFFSTDMNKDECKRNIQSEKEAHRELKYNDLFGRTPHLFEYKKKYCIISKWQKGQDLYNFSKKELGQIQAKEIIHSLIVLLNELACLHKSNRVHGDIKNQNCIFDPDSMSLNLIDFGSTRKVKPRNYWIPWTQHFLGKDINHWNPTNTYSFCDDMYALGLVTASLFPELYIVNLDILNSQIECIKNDFSLEEQAIDYLVQALTKDNRQARCTSAEALEYCNDLLSIIDNLSDENLNLLLNRSFNKNQLSTDEIIHGHDIIEHVSSASSYRSM